MPSEIGHVQMFELTLAIEATSRQVKRDDAAMEKAKSEAKHRR